MRRALVALCGVLAAAAATSCRDTLLDLSDGTVPSPSPSPSGTAPPNPILAGDGHDGPLSASSGSQTLNLCRTLVFGTAGTLQQDPTGFDVGRAVLVWQVQDSFATSGDESPVTAPGRAGLWEIVRVTAVSPSTLTVTPALRRAYQTEGPRAAQSCTIPEYTDVTLTGTAQLGANAWDAAGGVIALYASGTLTLGSNARITADGAGFRGGRRSDNASGNSIISEDTSAALGGEKGEGLDSTSRGRFGRGNVANGGGGGNADNAGGGGGGNGGAGGYGGKQCGCVSDLPATQGRGGARVDAPIADRLAMGGGGGGGHQNDVGATDGARGGGVVLLFVGALSGTGAISANGSSVTTQSLDGGGGGGAGGSVLVQAVTPSTFLGRIDTRGGTGGDSSNGVIGPGGGGGGGRIAHVEVNTITDVSGGESGIAGNVSPWGATNGANGAVELP